MKIGDGEARRTRRRNADGGGGVGMVSKRPSSRRLGPACSSEHITHITQHAAQRLRPRDRYPLRGNIYCGNHSLRRKEVGGVGWGMGGGVKAEYNSDSQELIVVKVIVF